jgi:hypothetical protein
MGKRRGAPPYNVWCNLAARRAIDVTQLAGHTCDEVQLGLILISYSWCLKKLEMSGNVPFIS